MYREFSNQHIGKFKGWNQKPVCNSPSKSHSTLHNSPVSLKPAHPSRRKHKKHPSKRDLSPGSSYEEEYNPEMLYNLPVSTFYDIIDCVIDDFEAFPYLSLPERTCMSPVRRREVRVGRELGDGRSNVQCTCRPKLYLHPSLHYKQLFLKSTLRESLYRDIGQLRLLSKSLSPSHSELVLVVHFEGVLGYWKRDTDGNAMQLVLRSEAVSGLAKLSETFRLVLISEQKRRLISAICRCLGVSFEAVYALIRPDYYPMKVVSYAKVCSDLGIADTQSKLLVVTRLDLACEDADSLTELHWKAGSKIRPYAVNMPISTLGMRPAVALLIPHMEAESSGTSYPFSEVVSAIYSLHSLCETTWATGFHHLQQHSQPGLLPLSTSAIHEVLMSTVLAPPTPESFARFHSSHICALHWKLAWGVGSSLKPFSNHAIVMTSQGRKRTEEQLTKVQVVLSGESLLTYSVS